MDKKPLKMNTAQPIHSQMKESIRRWFREEIEKRKRSPKMNQFKFKRKSKKK